jgi:hypothetical protein
VQAATNAELAARLLAGSVTAWATAPLAATGANPAVNVLSARAETMNGARSFM